MSEDTIFLARAKQYADERYPDFWEYITEHGLRPELPVGRPEEWVDALWEAWQDHLSEQEPTDWKMTTDKKVALLIAEFVAVMYENGKPDYIILLMEKLTVLAESKADITSEALAKVPPKVMEMILVGFALNTIKIALTQKRIGSDDGKIGVLLTRLERVLECEQVHHAWLTLSALRDLSDKQGQHITPEAFKHCGPEVCMAMLDGFLAYTAKFLNDKYKPKS